MHVWYSFPVFVLNSFLHRFKNLGYLKVFKLNGLIKIEMYMDMIRPNHLFFFSNFSYRVAFFPLFHPHRHVFMHCCIHSHKSLQCCFDEGAGGRSEEDSVCEGGGDEVRRYFWLDFTVECLKWLTSARGFAPFVTLFFFLPGSFALNDVAVTTPVVHKHTDWHLQEGRKKNPYASWFHLLTHTHWCTHSAPPLLVLSPPRGTEIFLSPVKP